MINCSLRFIMDGNFRADSRNLLSRRRTTAYVRSVELREIRRGAGVSLRVPSMRGITVRQTTLAAATELTYR